MRFLFVVVDGSSGGCDRRRVPARARLCVGPGGTRGAGVDVSPRDVILNNLNAFRFFFCTRSPRVFGREATGGPASENMSIVSVVFWFENV